MKSIYRLIVILAVLCVAATTYASPTKVSIVDAVDTISGFTEPTKIAMTGYIHQYDKYNPAPTHLTLCEGVRNPGSCVKVDFDRFKMTTAAYTRFKELGASFYPRKITVVGTVHSKVRQLK